MRRHEYVLALDAPLTRTAAPDNVIRQPTPADAETLAELMLDAYLDTIDY